MFTRTAKFYDAMYAFKDYSKEAAYIHDLIEQHKNSAGNKLLDVACGTGMHAKELAAWYEVEGLDLDEGLLQIASERNPATVFHHGDMLDFDLGKTFDVVACLFSSIGYATTLADMDRAVRCMAMHLAPGGVLLIEPWLYKDVYKPGHLHALFVDQPDLKIARMSDAKREGDVSVIDFHYLIAEPGNIAYQQETHRLGLYSQTEYMQAIEQAGLTADYDPIGPMNRGLFIGHKPS